MLQKNKYLNMALNIHSSLDEEYQLFINENKKYIYKNATTDWNIISEVLISENNDKNNLHKSKLKNNISNTKLFLESYDFEYHKFILKECLREYQDGNFGLKNYFINSNKNLHRFLNDVSRKNLFNLYENIDRLKLDECNNDLSICGVSLSTYQTKYLLRENKNKSYLSGNINVLSNEFSILNEGIWDWLKGSKLGKFVADSWKSVVNLFKNLTYKIGNFFKGCTLTMSGVSELRDAKSSMSLKEFKQQVKNDPEKESIALQKLYQFQMNVTKTANGMVGVQTQEPEKVSDVKESNSLLKKLADWLSGGKGKNLNSIVQANNINTPFSLLQWITTKVSAFFGLKKDAEVVGAQQTIKENKNIIKLFERQSEKFQTSFISAPDAGAPSKLSFSQAQQSGQYIPPGVELTSASDLPTYTSTPASTPKTSYSPKKSKNRGSSGAGSSGAGSSGAGSSGAGSSGAGSSGAGSSGAGSSGAGSSGGIGSMIGSGFTAISTGAGAGWDWLTKNLSVSPETLKQAEATAAAGVPWYDNWVNWLMIGGGILATLLISVFIRNKKAQQPQPPPKPTQLTQPESETLVDPDDSGKKSSTSGISSGGGEQIMQRKGLFGRILDMLSGQSDERLMKAFQRYANDPDAERQLNVAIDRFGPQEGIIRFVRQHEYNEELIRDFAYVLNRLPAGDLEYLGLGGGIKFSDSRGTGTSSLPQIPRKQKGITSYKFGQVISMQTNDLKFSMSKALKKTFNSNLKVIADQIQDRDTKREFKKEIKNLWDEVLNKYFSIFKNEVNNIIGSAATNRKTVKNGDTTPIDKDLGFKSNAGNLIIDSLNLALKNINLIREFNNILVETWDKTAKENAVEEISNIFNDILSNISIEDVIEDIMSGLSLGDDEPAYETLFSHLESLFNSFSDWITKESTVKKIVNQAVAV